MRLISVGREVKAREPRDRLLRSTINFIECAAGDHDTYVFTFSIETILLQLANTSYIDRLGNAVYSPELNQEKDSTVY